jgi:WD40 repeat protein
MSAAPSLPAVPGHDLIRRIGKGSYGEVWLAKARSGAWCAVKFVWRDRFTSERPYEREFQGIKRFEPASRGHDSQVVILDVGRDDSAGVFYYIMELADDRVHGQLIDPEIYQPRTLRSDLDLRGRLSARETVEVGVILCTALEHLHACGLVHRDIKPSNVIYIHGRPKLADIGLVAAMDETVSFVGTEGFVPPEGPGTARADIYGLGRVLYELFSGRDQEHFPEVPTALSEGDNTTLACELNLVILKACAYDPDQRHVHVTALKQELLLLQGGQSIRRLREMERRARFLKRFGMAAALLVLILIGALVATYRVVLMVQEEKARAVDAGAAALLGQARALRGSGQAGRRIQALHAIAEAARVRPTRKLRDEAIACLALTDIAEIPGSDTPYPPGVRDKALGDPTRVQFSPDFQRVAWCMDDNSILITTASDGRELRRIPSPNFKSLLSIAWSPSGKHIAATYRGSAFAIHVEDGRPVFDVPSKSSEPTSTTPIISFSADGGRFAAAKDGELVLGTISNGLSVEAFHPFGDTKVIGCLLHPTRTWVAVWTEREMIVWDYTTARTVTRRPTRTYPAGVDICYAAWSPDGRILALALLDRTILLVDVADETLTKGRLILHGHTERPLRIGFNTAGTLLASSSRDGNTRLWDTLSGGESLASSSRGVAIGFHPGSDQLAFTHTGGIGHWTVMNGHPAYRSIAGRLRGKLMGDIDFSADGRWLAGLPQDPDGHWLCDLQTGQFVAESTAPGVRRKWLAFIADKSHILTAGVDGLVEWPVGDSFAPGGKRGFGEPRVVLPPFPQGVYNQSIVTLSKDHRYLAGRIADKHIVLVDLQHPGEHRFFQVAIKASSLAFTPDMRRLVLGASEAKEKSHILDLADGSSRQIPMSDGPASVSCSLDGRWIVLYGLVDCVFLDAKTLDPIHRYPRYQSERHAGVMEFSPDGAYFAFLRNRGQVELLDAHTLNSLATIEIPGNAPADDLHFSPDCTYLGIHDSTQLHLYHLPSLRRELATMGLDW